MSTEARDIRWFATLRLADVPLVGGKNASLGELYRDSGVPASGCRTASPLTAEAYRDGADGSRCVAAPACAARWAGRH